MLQLDIPLLRNLFFTSMETSLALGAQVNNDATTTISCNRSDVERPKKPMKKTRRRSSSSLTGFSYNPNEDHSSPTCPYRRSSSLSLSTEFAKASPKESFDDQQYDLLPMKSALGLSPGQKAKDWREEETSLASLKAQRDGRGVSWQWLRIRKGIRTKKANVSRGRTSIDDVGKISASKGKYLQDQFLSSEEESNEEVDLVTQKIDDLNFDSACLSGQSCQHQCKNKGISKCHSSTSLSNKYQPKLFEDIAGHEIVIKALSNAVQKEKIAPLYLFHGPRGTGKTSTARILAMALNCESSSQTKPCWSCRGCTRSLYIMDLCSGSRISGFERIRTLVQSTTFTQIVIGFKVFIIEECHLLTADAWEEISTIVEQGSTSNVIFVMVTEDVNMVPRIISSRCQKFSFPKLKDTDITLKLARIVARENIGIEREALKLIISKADGSMREAENILDQLALLGSKITSPMVQQIVGLVPHNKLLNLLTTFLSADTINTVRSTRELIASGVEPQSLITQLASLVSDILSGAAVAATASSPGSSKDKKLSRTGSQLTNNQSEKLSHALKMLVETEKQLSSSSDQTNWLIATLLQIASERVPNRISSGIVLPRDIVVPSSTSDCNFESESIQNSINLRKNELSDLLHRSKSRKYPNSEQPDINTNNLSPNMRSTSKTKRTTTETVESEPSLRQEIGNMEEMWQNMLGRIQSGYVKEFLCSQGRLASLTISSANAIVHLLFKRPEDKLAAQMSEDTIANALEHAIGSPVTVNMSLDPMHLEIIEGNSASTTKNKVPECGSSKQEQSPTQFLRATESLGSSKSGVAMRRSKSQKSSIGSQKSRHMRMQANAQKSQGQDKCASGEQEASKTRPQQILPFSGPLTQGNKRVASMDNENDPTARVEIPTQTANADGATKSKHSWLSLSSIQQADASVEQYSQDLLFEHANSGREKGKRSSKLYTGFPKDNEDQHCQQSGTLIRYNRSWSCSEIFCRRV